MAMINSMDVIDTVKTGAGYYYVANVLSAYDQQRFWNINYEVNGVKLGWYEIVYNKDLSTLQKYAAAFREAYDHGGKVTFTVNNSRNETYDSWKYEDQVVTFPTLTIGKASSFETTPAQINSAPSSTSVSKYIFTFQGANGNGTGSIEYQLGTSITKLVTQGISKTTGSSTEQSYGIAVSVPAFGAELSGNKQFTQAWSESQTIDFTDTDERTTTSSTTLTTNIDFNGLPQNTDGTYQLGNSKLVVGQKYVVVVKISHEIVSASIFGYAPILGPEIGWHHQFGPGKISLSDAIAAGSAITGNNFTNGVPLEAEARANVAITGEVAPPTPTNYLASPANLAATSGISKTPTQTNVMVLAYADQSNVDVNVNDKKGIDIDVGVISPQTGENGIYLDLSNENYFVGKPITISGNSQQNFIKLGDLDHTLISFKNSIIESGSGFNHIIIKDGDVRNSYILGGGGDTIDISGDQNIIDAGAGANSIIVRGSGSNTLLSGPGADIVKLTSGKAFLTVTDWNPNEDKIVLGGDLIGANVRVLYNDSLKSYVVIANDREIARLNTEIGIAPKIDNSGDYQGTKIIPIDLKAEKTIFINDVYTQALDRAPDRDGLKAWSSVIDVNLTRKDFLQAVFTGTEYTQQNRSNDAFVNELYIDLLGRHADKLGQKGHVDALNAGLSRADLVDIFIQSNEFVQLVGQANLHP